jgi:diguanylate cyclase (GGDEF)-like protein
MFDQHGVFTGYRGLGRDISQQKQAEDTIRHLAFEDALTKLPNRRLLLDRLQQAMIASARTGQKNTLLFLDLDNFKPVNDAYGHAAGDCLLQQLALRIKNCVRSIDTIARLGGDEFIVLLADVGTDLGTAMLHTRQVGEKILQAVSLPYDLGKHRHQCLCSMGAVVLMDPTQSIESYLKQADAAMYQAKAAGRYEIHFFTGPS